MVGLRFFSRVLCRWVWFASFVILPFSTDAAFEFLPTGAPAAGVGGVGVAMARGADGAFWNPAAVAFGTRGSLCAGFERPFGMAALDTQTLGAAVRLRRLGFGATYQGYGFALYREQIVGMVAAFRVSERAGIGVRVRALSLTVADRAVRGWVVFDLGVRARLHDRVWWGASAWNAGGIQTGLIGQGGATGLGISVGNRATVMVDVQKEAGWPTGVGMGIVMRAAAPLILRFGTGGQPERLSAGFGVRHGLLRVDYAAAWHTVLGLSHTISLGVGD